MPTIQNPVLEYARMAEQREYVRKIREALALRYETPPLALVHSYGCQQNAADGEKLKGLLAQMGYGFTDSPDQADLIIREAKAKAAEIIREANAEIAKLESKYAEMKQQVESYKMRVSAIIKSQLDILDDLSAESGAPISNE